LKFSETKQGLYVKGKINEFGGEKKQKENKY